MIEKISLTNFTVFTRLDVVFSPKINIIIGENGTGKTHLLKAVFALCSANNTLKKDIDVSQEEISRLIQERFLNTFMPLKNQIGSMLHFGSKGNAQVEADFEDDKRIAFTFHENSKSLTITENKDYQNYVPEPVFIPTKEVLALMEGFVSLYNKFHLSFDITYYDICSLLDLPLAREERLNDKTIWAINEIEKLVGGKFIFHGGGRVTFKTEENEYSANVIAEGFRKAGMLARLLETGTILPGESGPFLWDEPEGNMNPMIMKLIVEIMLELSRKGQQIIIATHDYVLLKWFDLLMDKDKGDEVRFHTLYSDSGEIKLHSTNDYIQINDNAISDAFADLFDEDVKRALGGSR